MATILVALVNLWIINAGCTAPGYKLAPKKTPPPVMIDLASTEPPIEAVLHTVIIYHGPGSWKRNAYFDEYVVTIANRGSALIRLESASLTDFQNQASTAGLNPWELEATSRRLADKGFGLAESSIVQIGGGVTAISAATAGIVVAFGGGSAGVLVSGALVLPAFLVGTVYTNISNHNAVVREFNRRRMNLPADLLPGQLAQGSLFFRVSPGPQRLTLKCRVDGEPRDFVINLAPLAGLHLNPARKLTAPAALTAPPP